MKINRKPLSFFLAIISLVFISCGELKDPELVGIDNVGIERMGMKESAFTAELRYHNPNKFRIKMKEAEGDAWIDGNKLGHFTMDTLIHVKPNAEFSIPISMQMDMRNFMGNMAMIISGKPVILKIEGKARVGKSLVYINYPLIYEEKINISELLNK